MRTLYVARQGAEAALVEDGRLAEYVLDEKGEDGSLLLGRVERVMTGMSAAFVNIGQSKNGFLPMKEESLSFEQQSLRAGDRVLVQIKREAHGDKGAYLTRDVALPGEYLLLMPMNRYIGVSAKITNEARKTQLRQLGQRLTERRTGLVLRTSAANADETLIAADFDRLWQAWQEISRTWPTAHAPSVIRSLSTGEAMLRDMAPLGLDAVYTDDVELAERWPDVPVILSEGEPQGLEALRHEARKALSRHTWLKSGGSLVIDECEALTVIDVNTAKYTGKRRLEDTALRTNLEACPEIVRQLRLRGIGGIIIIDYIDMETDEERAHVREALEAALKADRAKTVVHGFTSLGLMEMTRKRTRRPLREMLAETGNAS